MVYWTDQTVTVSSFSCAKKIYEIKYLIEFLIKYRPSGMTKIRLALLYSGHELTLKLDQSHTCGSGAWSLQRVKTDSFQMDYISQCFLSFLYFLTQQPFRRAKENSQKWRLFPSCKCSNPLSQKKNPLGWYARLGWVCNLIQLQQPLNGAFPPSSSVNFNCLILFWTWTSCFYWLPVAVGLGYGIWGGGGRVQGVGAVASGRSCTWQIKKNNSMATSIVSHSLSNTSDLPIPFGEGLNFRMRAKA